MRIPTIHGYIDRRILVNYTGDLDVIRKIIPAPFRPKNYRGRAIIGMCLIRLKQIKPKGFPDILGISSENAAHRIAVEWDEKGETKEGVYIPRRDTSLWFNSLVGGRMFPGKHYLAKFDVEEKDSHYNIDVLSSDQTQISISATEANEFNPNSIFENLDNASAFFKNGNVGYSPCDKGFDGLNLNVFNWNVRPLHVKNTGSSFFENESIFPKGSVTFDNALLMVNAEHEWRGIDSK